MFNRFAAQLRYGADGQCEVADRHRALIARAPLVIVANAHASRGLLGDDRLPLGVTRGQVSFVPQSAGPPLRAPVCREGYVTPAVGGMHCVGASYASGSEDTSERLEDHAGNLDRLRRLLPDYAQGVDPSRLTGRVGLRAVAPDRMPVLGPWPAGEGVFICTGLASRGLALAPLLAETLASMICGEPSPIERSLQAKLAPARFAKLQPGARSW